MRGFWQGMAAGSILVAALSVYLSAPERLRWESRGWERRRRGAWRDAAGRIARALR